MEGTAKILTRPDALTVYLRWSNQYPPHTSDQGKHRITEALAALPEHASRSDIDATIGNGSWTRLECDICGTDSEKVIRFELYERFVDVCVNCTKAALEKARGE